LPIGESGSTIVAAEAEQVERTRRKNWSRARSEVFVPHRLTASLVVGIDPSPAMLAEAVSSNARLNARYVRAAAEALPLPDGRFDLALLSRVIHHLDDRHRAAAELFSTLRPGGVAVVRTTVRERLDALVYEYFPGLREIDARRFAGREELVAEFRTGGFAPKAETSFAQPVASTLREFREKVALRAQSKFAHLSEEEFREGMSRLDRMVRAEQSPAPVSERYDVLVFERKHGAM
jgi:SAM-dependent methyltransferase